MALFDALIDDLAHRSGLGGAAAPLAREALALIIGADGGIAGFVGLFKRAGLGPIASSWLGKTYPAPLSTSELKRRNWRARNRCDRASGRNRPARYDSGPRLRAAETRGPSDASGRRSGCASGRGFGFSCATLRPCRRWRRSRARQRGQADPHRLRRARLAMAARRDCVGGRPGLGGVADPVPAAGGDDPERSVRPGAGGSRRGGAETRSRPRRRNRSARSGCRPRPRRSAPGCRRGAEASPGADRSLDALPRRRQRRRQRLGRRS